MATRSNPISVDLTKYNYNDKELSKMPTMEQLIVANRIRNQQMLQALGLNADTKSRRMTPKQQNTKVKKSRKETKNDPNWIPDMAAEEDSDNVDTLVREESCAAAQKSKKSFASRIKPDSSADNSANPAPSPVLSVQATVAVTPLTKSAKRRIGKKAAQTASLASEMHKYATPSDICHNSNGHQNHSPQTNTLGSASRKTTTATAGPTACVQPFTGFTAEQIEAARQRSIEAQNREEAIIRLMRAKQLSKNDITIIEPVGCYKCKKDNEGLSICPTHHYASGQLDNAEPDNRLQGYKATKSLPEGLLVKESPTPGARHGVYTGQFTRLCKDMTYGPYQGVRVYNESEAHQSGYCWQIYCKRKISHWIDALDVRRSNWLRYINCAATTDQQNVCAYQVGQNIYYRTVVDIGPDMELLVWYGDDYAKELGLHSMAFMASIDSSTINGVNLACWDCQLEFRCRQLLNQQKFTVHDTVNTNIVAVVGTTRCVINTVATRQVRGSVASSGAVVHKPRIAGSPCSAISGVAVFPGSTASAACDYKQHDCYVGINEGFCAPSARLTDPVVNKCQVTACSGGAGVLLSGVQSSVDVSRQVVDTDDGRRVQCSTCSKLFKTRVQLIKHTRIHTAEKPFECSTCGRRFTLNDSLTRHSRVHSGDRPFECMTCGRIFSLKDHLTRHSLIHTGEKSVECATCGQRFRQTGDLTRHSNIHAGKKPFECNTCGQRFTRNANLMVHSFIHTGAKPFECTTCGQRFSQKCILKRHCLIHTGVKPLECTYCGKRFSLNCNLTRHSRIHTGERPFACTTCGQRFRRNDDLTKHSFIHTGMKPFECATCAQRFSTKGHLARHRLIHTGEKPFECIACGQRFALKCDLTRHSRIHTGDRPFECTTCGQRFSLKGNLTRHSFIHTGEKPFESTECGQRFWWNGDLTKHSRIHTGEKPFECEMCGQRFTLNGDLTIHSRTHTGEKPFE